MNTNINNYKTAFKLSAEKRGPKRFDLVRKVRKIFTEDLPLN